MKQLRLSIFNSRIKYYNLRIVPPDPVFNEVTELKKQFENLFGKQPLSKSKPHITIATFKMNSRNQNFLKEVFKELSQKETFVLNIDGFGVFENSKTIYLNVSKNEALKNIYQNIRLLRDGHLRGKHKLFEVVDNPHMTISKTSGKKMLDESLQYFRKNEYARQIQVDELTLVSRSKYKTWDWEYHIKLS